MIPSSSFVLELAAVVVLATSFLSNLAVLVLSLRGKPTVRKDEFDEHRNHVYARLNGTNEKIDQLENKTQSDLKNLVSTLGHINADLQRVVGRLEGQVEKTGRKS